MNEPIGDTLHAVEPEPSFKSDAPLIPRIWSPAALSSS